MRQAPQALLWQQLLLAAPPQHWQGPLLRQKRPLVLLLRRWQLVPLLLQLPRQPQLLRAGLSERLFPLPAYAAPAAL